MKPIAVINVAKLANTEIDQPKKLHEAGYIVIYAADGPAIMLHQAAPGRRERIATAMLAGFCARQSPDWVDQNLSRIAASAGAFIKELDK